MPASLLAVSGKGGGSLGGRKADVRIVAAPRPRRGAQRPSRSGSYK